jgi:hypothetical protein
MEDLPSPGHEPMAGSFNPLIPELNPICYLLALLAHDCLHVSRIRVNIVMGLRVLKRKNVCSE